MMNCNWRTTFWYYLQCISNSVYQCTICSVSVTQCISVPYMQCTICSVPYMQCIYQCTICSVPVYHMRCISVPYAVYQCTICSVSVPHAVYQCTICSVSVYQILQCKDCFIQRYVKERFHVLHLYYREYINSESFESLLQLTNQMI